MEVATDGVNEHSISGSGLETARLFERQDAFNPPGAFVSVGALGTFTPHHGESQGALGPVIRRFHAVFQEKDPQRLHLTEQVSDQLSGLVFSLMVAMDEVAKPGIPGPPLPPGRREWAM